eukprot:scaffold22_cov107-Isochrysis_galbana.AAC.2
MWTTSATCCLTPTQVRRPPRPPSGYAPPDRAPAPLVPTSETKAGQQRPPVGRRRPAQSAADPGVPSRPAAPRIPAPPAPACFILVWSTTVHTACGTS